MLPLALALVGCTDSDRGAGGAGAGSGGSEASAGTTSESTPLDKASERGGSGGSVDDVRDATAGSSPGGTGGEQATDGGMGGASGAGQAAGAGGTGGVAEIAGAGGASGAAGTAGAMDTFDAGVQQDEMPLGKLELSELTIEENPQMVLGCYVTWTTSEASNSEVQFGIDGHRLRVVDAELSTEHRVYVVGMHPQTAYDIRAVSTNDTATGSAEGTFTTGPLPDTIPERGTLVTEPLDAMQPGWTLTNVQLGARSVPSIALIVDELGFVVWYFIQGPAADTMGTLSTELLPNGNVLIGNTPGEPAREVDLEGNVVWEGPTGGDARLSHHTDKLSNGNYVVTRESSSSARVEEITPENDVVWTWDLYDHVQSPGVNDWCHLNSAAFDAAEEFVYLNCRFLGLFKAERSSGELLWHMGAAMTDSNSGDITYLPDNSVRFNDAHDPEVHADGTILFYDNQGWSGRGTGEQNGNYHSRVVEYQLDEETLQATLSWEFPGDFDTDSWYTDDWQTEIWGDADRLENGNVLVTAGVRSAGASTRIFEVTREGQVVWALEWPVNHGSYRADRIPALAQPVP